ncbi:hypothetical protein V6Z11_D12G018200 [Gossypium hirsutum]
MDYLFDERNHVNHLLYYVHSPYSSFTVQMDSNKQFSRKNFDEKTLDWFNPIKAKKYSNIQSTKLHDLEGRHCMLKIQFISSEKNLIIALKIFGIMRICH